MAENVSRKCNRDSSLVFTTPGYEVIKVASTAVLHLQNMQRKTSNRVCGYHVEELNDVAMGKNVGFEDAEKNEC